MCVVPTAQSHRDSNLKTQWLAGHMAGPNYIHNISPSPFRVAQGKLKHEIKIQDGNYRQKGRGVSGFLSYN